MQNRYEKATFAGGCFWCVEAIFKRLKGVKEVVSGYTGGNVKSPSYEQVSSGATGHAEAVQITFDSNVVSYEELLNVFLQMHDPTTLNRQGNDVGTQYRSEIFYHTGEQKKLAEKVIKNLSGSEYEGGIVTKVSHIREFYPAEEYHKEYYEKNRKKPYCTLVIDPKIKKLKEGFRQLIK